jgi:hypothetical protein
VRLLERIGDLACDAQCVVERQRPLESLPFDVLHHEIMGPDVVQRADIGMVERRYSPRLALEPIAELLGRDLDRHFPIETCIVGAIHLPHATDANLGGDLVRADSVACGERHWSFANSTARIICGPPERRRSCALKMNERRGCHDATS